MTPAPLLAYGMARAAREIPPGRMVFFGAVHGATALAIVFALVLWGRKRRRLARGERRSADLEAIGLALLFAALWLACGVAGVGLADLAPAAALTFLASALFLLAGVALRGR
jgi:hypothetical protein